MTDEIDCHHVAVHRVVMRFHGIGPRLGMTINPDQFHFGGHIDFGDLAENLMMLPNLEIGVGDNLTTSPLLLNSIIVSAPTGERGRRI